MPSPAQGSAAIAGKNGHSLISNEKFKQLFSALVSSQLLNSHLRETAKAASQPHREAGPAGLVLDLRPEDTLLLPTPQHFAQRIKGTPLHEVVTGSTAASTGKLGRRLAEAIAVAVNNRLEKNNAIVLILFELEDQHSGLSAYEEVFAVAMASKLPILFVLESAEGFADSAALKEKLPMLPYIEVDAHDLVAVYRVAQESIMRTREGAGPAIVELAPFTPEGGDPVDKMHHYLHARGLPAKRWKSQAQRRFEKDLRGLSSPA